MSKTTENDTTHDTYIFTFLIFNQVSMLIEMKKV